MNRLLVGDLVCLRPVLLHAQVTCVDLILAFETPADLVSFVENASAVDSGGTNNELFCTLWRRASASERALGLLDARPQYWNAAQVVPRANHDVAPRLPPSRPPQSTKESRSHAPGPAKKPRVAPHNDKGVPSLKLLEADKKRVWVQKLQVFAQRAGASAGLFARAQELSDDHDTIVTAVLSMGAWRTLRGHVLRWKKMTACKGNWYPPDARSVYSYLSKIAPSCGTSSMPSAISTVSWMCRRLQMEEPLLQGGEFKALQAEVVERRGRAVKEARPLDMRALPALEMAAESWASDQVPYAVFVWQWLCLAWGSLRFDDALHTSPSSLVLTDTALFFTSWQTKVERKRRGTAHAVCNVSSFVCAVADNRLQVVFEQLARIVSEISGCVR